MPHKYGGFFLISILLPLFLALHDTKSCFTPGKHKNVTGTFKGGLNLKDDDNK